MGNNDKKDIGVDCVKLVVYYAVRGFSAEEIYQFIDEIIAIMEGGGNFTVSSANIELEKRGKTELKVNNDTLGLIVNILIKRYGHNVEEHSIN